jgi:hypothetical protein
MTEKNHYKPSRTKSNLQQFNEGNAFQIPPQYVTVKKHARQQDNERGAHTTSNNAVTMELETMIDVASSIIKFRTSGYCLSIKKELGL